MTRLLLNAPLTSLAMVVAAIVGGCYALGQLIVAALARRWPTVEGEIVGAYLIQVGFDARGLHERVTYRYSVAGQRIVNKTACCMRNPRARTVPSSSR